MSELPKPLGDELRHQIGQAIDRAEGLIPPEDEPKKLLTELPGDETEEVPFNPANPGFSDDREIEVNGFRIRIHETNNFHEKFGIFIRPQVKSKGATQSLETYERVFAAKFDEIHIAEIIEGIKHRYPKLYDCLVSTVTKIWQGLDAECEALELYGKDSPQHQRAKRERSRTYEEELMEDYYFSKAYDAAAIIVAELGLEVNIQELC